MHRIILLIPFLVSLAAQPPAVYRVGGGVSAPSVISRREPDYTDEARRLHMNSTVVLSLVVGDDGVPRDIKLLRAVGAGLDEQTIETVQTWRFKPGQREGKPVNVATYIEVNFRTFDDSPWLLARLVFENKDTSPHALKIPLPGRPVPHFGARVTFDVVVDASGQVNIDKTSGADGLDTAVTESLEKTVRKWKFRPALRNGEKVEAKGQIELIHGDPPPVRITEPAVPVPHVDPKNADEALRDGLQMMRTRQFDEAVRLLTKAIEFKADWAQALGMRAQAYSQLQRYPEAIRDLDEALRLSPDQALYYANRGGANLQLGDAEKALTDLNKAIEIAPNLPRAYENRASAYLKLADYAKSSADYTAAIRLSPTRSNYEGRAEAKRASGDFSGAEEDLKRASELPKPPP